MVSLKYEEALAHCGVFRHEKKFKNILDYFDSFQISEQFTYILTPGKAMLPRYLPQGGAHFKLHFLSRHK
jgi:hypothetical protein